MKRLLLVTTLFSFTLCAQTNNFPEKWIGEYQGGMTLAYLQRPNDTIPVDFTFTEVIADSVWTYKMVYRSEKYGVIEKDYLIRAATLGDKVNFELDEQNGIIMEMTLMNNCFFGMYEVMGDIYSTTIRLHDGGIFFELYAAATEDPRISKLEDDTEGTIEATSYKSKLVQSVFLKRK